MSDHEHETVFELTPEIKNGEVRFYVDVILKRPVSVSELRRMAGTLNLAADQMDEVLKTERSVSEFLDDAVRKVSGR
ncbi:hypothetical protein ACFFUB_00360 [Algimonas porphyrae]|uniref:Uncharacterized protein n=1 Tax=Algimonas porphyrae TaxID=1128113 RepID=A0ABQ5V1L5_9PROT|nr:hypothetical protein [Algimonas porphyrae]GLQ20481.1 hypothetical protein GCM10007854_14360 [Algimonas porphyrae]